MLCSILVLKVYTASGLDKETHQERGSDRENVDTWENFQCCNRPLRDKDEKATQNVNVSAILRGHCPGWKLSQVRQKPPAPEEWIPVRATD